MAENEDKPEALSGEEALALAREGKDAWNAWAAENRGQSVDFTGVDFTDADNTGISFGGYLFPGEAKFTKTKFQEGHFEGCTFEEFASFDWATFMGAAMFETAVFRKGNMFYEATFKGLANFVGATVSDFASFTGVTFGELATFSHAIFKGRTLFDRATFEKAAFFNSTNFEESVTFIGGTFSGLVSLEGCRFAIVPDFRRSQFFKHTTLHGTHVDFRTPEEGDADKYRRLKELAVNARDHDREQFFFACELKAKRGFETLGWALVPNYLYEWLSDFGRSLGRPVFFLAFTWFLFGLVYGAGLGKTGMGISGLIYSAAHLVPFLPGSRERIKTLEKLLFDNPTPDIVFALTTIEGVLGVILIFLIGLALRNRFRI